MQLVTVDLVYATPNTFHCPICCCMLEGPEDFEPCEHVRFCIADMGEDKPPHVVADCPDTDAVAAFIAEISDDSIDGFAGAMERRAFANALPDIDVVFEVRVAHDDLVRHNLYGLSWNPIEPVTEDED